MLRLRGHGAATVAAAVIVSALDRDDMGARLAPMFCREQRRLKGRPFRSLLGQRRPQDLPQAGTVEMEVEPPTVRQLDTVLDVLRPED
jgi:hypothetical protein